MKSKKKIRAVLLCLAFVLQAVFVGGCEFLTEVIENGSSESTVAQSTETEQSVESSIEESFSDESSTETEESTDEGSSSGDSSSEEESSEVIPCEHNEVGGIVITAQPTKTTYSAGESFDASGMVVKTSCKDCGEGLDEVDGYTIEYPSGRTSFRESDTYVTVVYGAYRVAVGISVGAYTPGVPI